jgi:hypothetical protein
MSAKISKGRHGAGRRRHSVGYSPPPAVAAGVARQIQPAFPIRRIRLYLVDKGSPSVAPWQAINRIQIAAGAPVRLAAPRATGAVDPAAMGGLGGLGSRAGVSAGGVCVQCLRGGVCVGAWGGVGGRLHGGLCTGVGGVRGGSVASPR